MNLKNLIKNLGIQKEQMSLPEFIEEAQTNSSLYANTAERLLKAIGKPKLVDTKENGRLRRIFGNKTIAYYDVFHDFYGMENVIEDIVSHLKFVSQNLEEKKQILYLLGPVGSAKSSLAERLKQLIEKEPIYVLADDKGNLSPVFESPFGLFDPLEAKKLKLPEYILKDIPSPWAIKKVNQIGLHNMSVYKTHPNRLNQISVAKTEPGDENTQDISTLVGKVNLRELEHYNQNDPDAYSYDGGLCKANQGILDFVEMFKAPIKMLHPLLTATQEGNYNPTNNMGALPFNGLILSHSNESEWEIFRANKQNEALLDRINLIKVPYCLRMTEEKQIYNKLLEQSTLKDIKTPSHTLNILSEFSVLTRLDEPKQSNIYVKAEVYDGEDVKSKYPEGSIETIQEYRQNASSKEGFKGFSTRSAFKVLSKVFNYDLEEVGADPLHMLYLLEKYINTADITAEDQETWLTFLKEHIEPKFLENLGKDIQTAYISSYKDLGQNIFDKYIMWAECWLDDQTFRDENTGELLDRSTLNDELENIEKRANINNAKDFRNEIVRFYNRYKANKGKAPSWKSYNKIKNVIEANIFESEDMLLGKISFDNVNEKTSEGKRHKEFVDRMKELGFTDKQVQRNVNYYIRKQKSKS